MEPRGRCLGFIVLGFILFAALIVSACGKKEERPVPEQRGTTSPKMPVAKFSHKGMTSISDNPQYFSMDEKSPASIPVKDLDRLIRPVLVKLFGGAKLIEEADNPVTQRDGEVILNSMKYSVRRLLDGPAGDELHQALKKDAHFSSTPRLGSKPVHGRKQVAMSLSKSTSRGGYSLVISLDLINQFIEIRSYKLGSKYDRLM